MSPVSAGSTKGTPCPPWRRRFVRLGLKATERILAVIGLCTLLRFAMLDVSVMVSGSMSPTLRGENAETGDWVLSEKLSRRLRAPRRWEIHQFYNGEGVLVAKRIIALPGESVSLHDGRLFIDGRPLAVPDSIAHIRYLDYGNLGFGKEVTCAENAYYVLGDDSRDSMDSRFEGTIPRERFVGRVIYVLAPAEHRGRVR